MPARRTVSSKADLGRVLVEQRLLERRPGLLVLCGRRERADAAPEISDRPYACCPGAHATRLGMLLHRRPRRFCGRLNRDLMLIPRWGCGDEGSIQESGSGLPLQLDKPCGDLGRAKMPDVGNMRLARPVTIHLHRTAAIKSWLMRGTRAESLHAKGPADLA